MSVMIIEERGGGSNKAHDVSTIRLYPEAI